MENDRNPDPYEVVIADLRSQKERIETTISLLESLRAGGGPVQISHASGIAPQPKKKRPDIGPGAFLGMSIPDAAREHEADEDEKHWEERLRKVAKPKPSEPKPH